MLPVSGRSSPFLNPMAKHINFLCVDDAGDDKTHSYLDFISDQSDRLTIEPSQPDEFSLQISILKKRLKPDEGIGFDGLILDLRLDGQGSKAHYRAPALAQEIHTRAVETASDNGDHSEKKETIESGFPVCP